MLLLMRAAGHYGQSCPLLLECVQGARVKGSLTCCTSCWVRRCSHSSSSVLTMSSTMASALPASAGGPPEHTPFASQPFSDQLLLLVPL